MDDKKIGFFIDKKLVKDSDKENTDDLNVRLTESPLIGFYVINEKELVTVYGNGVSPFASSAEDLIATYGVNIRNDRSK